MENSDAGIIEGIDQSGFADDVCGAAGGWFGDECGGSQCAGVEVLLIDFQAEARELFLQFARRTLAAIGQEEEMLLFLFQHLAI